MPFYHALGQIPRKRHIVFRKPDGGLYHEHLMGNEGFTGPSALLYHIHPPTTVKAVRRMKDLKYEGEPRRLLKHRHFRTAGVTRGGSPTLDRKLVMYNDDIAMLYAVPGTEDQHFYRNAQGDEVVYVVEEIGRAHV